METRRYLTVQPDGRVIDQADETRSAAEWMAIDLSLPPGVERLRENHPQFATPGTLRWWVKQADGTFVPPQMETRAFVDVDPLGIVIGAREVATWPWEWAKFDAQPMPTAGRIEFEGGSIETRLLRVNGNPQELLMHQLEDGQPARKLTQEEIEDLADARREGRPVRARVA